MVQDKPGARGLQRHIPGATLPETCWLYLMQATGKWSVPTNVTATWCRPRKKTAKKHKKFVKSLLTRVPKIGTYSEMLLNISCGISSYMSWLALVTKAGLEKQPGLKSAGSPGTAYFRCKKSQATRNESPPASQSLSAPRTVEAVIKLGLQHENKTGVSTAWAYVAQPPSGPLAPKKTKIKEGAQARTTQKKTRSGLLTPAEFLVEDVWKAFEAMAWR